MLIMCDLKKKNIFFDLTLETEIIVANIMSSTSSIVYIKSFYQYIFQNYRDLIIDKSFK